MKAKPENIVVVKIGSRTRCSNRFSQEANEYSVLLTTNLSGIISRMLVHKSAVLGMAPGANIGDKAAVFEATHGTSEIYE